MEEASIEVFATLPVIFEPATPTIDASCTAFTAIEEAMTVVGRLPAAIWLAGRLPVIFAAVPEIFPDTFEPETPTIAASCTAPTAIEEAITVEGRLPAAIWFAGRLPVMFAAFPEIFPDTFEPETPTIAAS